MLTTPFGPIVLRGLFLRILASSRHAHAHQARGKPRVACKLGDCDTRSEKSCQNQKES